MKFTGNCIPLMTFVRRLFWLVHAPACLWSGERFTG